MEEEEEITHFSHEHPLIPLKQNPSEPEKHTDGENICICYGCKQAVLVEEEAYKCDGKYCETVFLHKQCAQLPREIMHPSHVQHSLILLTSPPFARIGPYRCNVCKDRLDGFNYYCSICDFIVDVKCALKEKESLVDYVNNKFKHTSHEHLLVYQPRPAAFRCSACDVEDKDLSYQCSHSDCPFWIHKSCGLLPNTAERNDHAHPLSLIYKLPSEYHSYYFYCGVCRGKIRPMHWAYTCRMCRYFVHIKCMAAQMLRTVDKYLYNDEDSTFEKRILKVLLPVDFLHLPVDDVSVDLIQRFLLRKNCLTNIQPVIDYSRHPQHPLTLSSGTTKEGYEEETICDACITPITTTHYSCVGCKFFLHVPCTKIPEQLQHPLHPHPLTLRHFTKFYEVLKCKICRSFSNGYHFSCQTCDFRIDIKCACLQTMIEHETHDHPLLVTSHNSSKQCSSGCGFPLRGRILFGCEPCNFYLHLYCVMLPKRFGHRFDYHHLLELSFPPYPDHPEPFDCLECEKEANPSKWLYRCKECDLNFHLYCIQYVFNVRFGQNLKFGSHKHPLKFVPTASVKSPCNGCGSGMTDTDYCVFECESCSFHICRDCLDWN